MGQRLTLKQMILNIIDNAPRGYSEDLASIAGYSNGSNLKKVLRDESKEFEKFNGLIKLVRHLFKQDEQIILEEYSKTIDPCNKTARCMLEYLSCNRLLESMKMLIERMAECKNKDSREFAKVYTLQHEWQSTYYTLDRVLFLKKINEIKTSLIELNVFTNLLKFYGFYRQQNYKMSYEISKLVMLEIDDIKEDYLKSMYKTKLNEALSYIELRVLNNPEVSRDYSEKVIESDIGLPFTSYAYYSKGCSYFFTSYEKSISNLNTSMELYLSANRNDVVNDLKEKIDLLNVLWDKESDLYTIGAKLLSEAKNSNLRECDLEKFKESIELPFYYLIKGIMDNSNDLLLQSVIQFIKIGDTFFSNIPKLELLKRGFNEEVLNALISLNKA